MERLSRMEKYAELRRRLEEKEPENLELENGNETEKETSEVVDASTQSENNNIESEPIDNRAIETKELGEQLDSDLNEDSLLSENNINDFLTSPMSENKEEITNNSTSESGQLEIADLLHSLADLTQDIVKEEKESTNETSAPIVNNASFKEINEENAIPTNLETPIEEKEESENSFVDKNEYDADEKEDSNLEVTIEEENKQEEIVEEIPLESEETPLEEKEEIENSFVDKNEDDDVDEKEDNDLETTPIEEESEEVSPLQSNDDSYTDVDSDSSSNLDEKIDNDVEETTALDNNVVDNNIHETIADSNLENSQINSEETSAEIKEELPLLEKENIKTEEDNYLEKTLKEVAEYNKAKGLVTADQITPTILNEIRNETTEIKEDGVQENTLSEKEQMDINDTVTLEIQNILKAIEEDEKKTPVEQKEEISESEQSYMDMWEKSSDELDNETESLMSGTSENKTDLIAPISIENKENTESNESEIKEEAKIEVKEENIGDTKVMPSIEQAKDREENIENVDKTLELTSNSLLNETKAYVINETNQDDKDEHSNKALNIILIILVIALVVILGITIYGLLKTMNII